MGVLDDIQQMQMQQVQQGAQQQGFAPPPAPQSPDQPISQIGAGQPQPDPSQGQMLSGQPDQVKQFLTSWLPAMQQNLQQIQSPKGFRQGFGSGMLKAAGLDTPSESAQKRQAAMESTFGAGLGLEKSNQAQQALDLQKQQVTIMGPNGPMSVPLALAKTLFPAQIRAGQSDVNNQRNNASKKLIAGYGDDGQPLALNQLALPTHLKLLLQSAQEKLTNARLDALNADPATPAGRKAIAQLNQAQQRANAASTAAGAAARNAGTNYDKYLGDYFGTDASGGALPGAPTDDSGKPMGIKTAGVDKAPASMLQSAEYAQGAQGELAAAKDAISKLRSHGVLTNIPESKMEELLFGTGLVDPSLSPEDQYLVGKARQALVFGASGIVRAHTGRGMKEMYQDQKSKLGIGQAGPALDASMDEANHLLGGYAKAASNKNIRALRNGGTVLDTVKAANDAPPASMLQEGKYTTFTGKGTWTLKKGVVTKVQDGK